MSSKINIESKGVGCVPQEFLVRYLNGELTDNEMYAVERHLSGCPMCADELEGLSLLDNPADIASISATLSSRVDKKLPQGTKLTWMKSPLSIAASIVVIIGVASLIYFTSTLRPSPEILSERIVEEQPVMEAPLAIENMVDDSILVLEDEPHTEDEVEKMSLTQQERTVIEKSTNEIETIIAAEPKPDRIAIKSGKSGPQRSSRVKSVPRVYDNTQPAYASSSAPRVRLKEKHLYSDMELDSDAVLFDVEYNDEIFVEQLSFISIDEEEPELEEEVVFVVVEEMPKFNGGDINNFRDYINSNLKYPEIAAENGIQGRVILSFVVEPTGKVSNVKVLRGTDSNLDKEAVRVIESSPLWEPGKQRGQPVRVSFILPVIFVLQ